MKALGNHLKYLTLFAILPVAAFLCLLPLILTSGPMKPVPAFETVKESYRRSEAILLDRHGEIIYEMRVDEKGRRLEWTKLAEISPALIYAVIHVEDRRFYKHHGIDWNALAASAFKNAISRKTRGASTITMQLASLLDRKLRPGKLRKTLRQKWAQILAARNIEKSWSKVQILEAYLNLISYRSELQGVRAASKGLFGKEPSGLNEPESLLLASLITSPNAEAEQVAQRAYGIAKSVGSPTKYDDFRNLAEERLSLPYRIKPAVVLAPHVAHMLLSKGKTRITSTLDGRFQKAAYELLNHHLLLLRESNVTDGAILVAENRTGEILVYLANSGITSGAPWMDGIIASRQAGSTLKPFLYELAIEKKLLTPASVLEDSPLHIPTPNGLYVPQNYDNLFKGHVSVRTALSASMNIPAVRTLLLLGVEPFVERLKKLGFESLTQDAEYYGYSIALGSADITLKELTNAYRTLANGGRWSALKLTFDDKATWPAQVLDKEGAYIVSHILSDREARSSTFGLENPLSTRFWTAVKTGTSKDMRDNWCVGYSRTYTVGVWVGNFSGQPMRNVSGVTGAAPLWLEMMNYLHSGTPSSPPKAPANIVFADVSFESDVEPPRKDCFIRGTEPASTVRLNELHQKARITYPTDGTLIALDPEIPEDLQRIPFQFKPVLQRYEWVLNDKRTGSSDPLFLWKPEKGCFRLSIVDKEDRVIDSVALTVK